MLLYEAQGKPSLENSEREVWDYLQSRLASAVWLLRQGVYPYTTWHRTPCRPQRSSMRIRSDDLRSPRHLVFSRLSACWFPAGWLRVTRSTSSPLERRKHSIDGRWSIPMKQLRDYLQLVVQVISRGKHEEREQVPREKQPRRLWRTPDPRSWPNPGVHSVLGD